MGSLNELQRRIDIKIEKLKKLREIADDPELLLMVQELVGGNPEPITESKRPEAAKDTSQSTARGELRRAIVDATNTFDRDTDFSAAEILAAVEQSGFEITDSRPRVAVSRTLRLLADRGDLDVTVEPRGRRAGRYKLPNSEVVDSAAERELTQDGPRAMMFPLRPPMASEG